MKRVTKGIAAALFFTGVGLFLLAHGVMWASEQLESKAERRR